jgi:ADP-ribose pyrophosphatase
MFKGLLPMKESILSTEPVFEGRLLKIYINTVELPDGRTAIREVIRHQGAVAVVPFDAEGNVLLVRQYRAGIDRDIIEIPAGLLEAGEDPAACAERELREETGYRPGILESLGGYNVAPGYTNEYIHLYLARDLEPAPLAQDSEEFLELIRLPFDEALAMVERGEISDSKTIIALYKVARQIARG